MLLIVIVVDMLNTNSQTTKYQVCLYFIQSILLTMIYMYITNCEKTAAAATINLMEVVNYYFAALFFCCFFSASCSRSSSISLIYLSNSSVSNIYSTKAPTIQV